MTPNTFVHIGDVHLKHGHPRNGDRLAALDQIVAEVTPLPVVSAILIPGDLFDAKSSVEDRNALAVRLQAFAAVAPVVLVRGNHDVPGDLDIFARLKARWPVYVVTRPTVLEVPLTTGDTAAIACVPYPDKVGLVAAGIAPGETSQTGAEVLDVIFMQLAAELAAFRTGGAIPLFAGHLNVRGSVASTGQPQIGMELEIETATLARLPVVYAALSHIHKPQEIGTGVYAGSIARLDYGEIEEKSYCVVACNRGAEGWTASYTRRPIHCPPMHHIEGQLTSGGFTEKDGTAHHAMLVDWTGADVRVRYTYNASERSVLREDTIREIFGKALRLKIEGVAVPDRALRNPEVAAAKTLPEKLAAYLQVDHLTPSVADKLALLQTKDQAAVLIDVAAALAEIEAPERVTAAA